MAGIDLDRWALEFEAFHARFAPFFARSEPRHEACQYLRGLLSCAERKNSWQMAEAVGERTPDPMQRLLYGAKWDADAVCAELQRFVVERFGEEEGIAVIDESAFVKKGEKSVGVKRQWCSTLGKKENCQVGVFLTYVSQGGHTFLDRRLYLPREWSAEWPRRRAAQVPDTVEFRTKPELAQAMLQCAWERGVPMRWVTGDETYGDSPGLRDAIHQRGLAHRLHYVMAIACNTHVWRQRPSVEEPGVQTGGRPREKVRVARRAPPSEAVAAVVASWPAEKWQRLSVGAGEKGFRFYDWAAERVVECRDRLPGEDLWLLARRGVAEPYEIAYYFSDAPERTPLRALANVAGARWSIEQCLEEGKGEAGLDNYEVRYWQSWHRHVTLSMMAHAWLAWIRNLERGAEGELRPTPEAEAGEKGTGSGGLSIPPTGVGTGRVHGARGAAPARRGPAVAGAVGRAPAGLVELASCEAAASAAEPLPTTNRRRRAR